jgi:hypothetical protein
MLGYHSMVPGGPFIASRDLGVVGASFGSSQPSVSMGAPDCPMAHTTLHSTMVKRSLIGHFPYQTGTRLSSGGTGLSGAPSDRWS